MPYIVPVIVNYDKFEGSIAKKRGCYQKFTKSIVGNNVRTNGSIAAICWGISA